jgi:predicted phage baseplate assembly protein
LRRSGILRLAWPAVWDRPGAGPRRLRATAVSASYTEPVRILAVHPNAAVARHRVAQTADVSDQLGGFLPLPGQLLRVPDAAGRLCDGDGDVVLSVTERSGGPPQDWHSVRTWVGSGPADRVFVVDRARGELRFGDGRRGRILRPAAAPGAQLRFFLGAGRQGNLGPLRAWAQAGGAAVAVNPVAAGDGDEQELLDAARQRAADALAARDRTVTEEDARELAQTTPGLGLRRAHVSPGFHPAFPCDPVPGALAVTIVPHADRAAGAGDWTAAPQPDTGALAETRQRLERARLLGQEIFVLAPVYRRVTVDVAVTATAQAGDTRGRIVDALRRYLDPLAGGSEHDGWPFGGPVRPSALAGIVQKTIGPEATVTRLSAALDGGAPSDCADLAIGPRELVWLGAATITWVAALPTDRGLR